MHWHQLCYPFMTCCPKVLVRGQRNYKRLDGSSSPYLVSGISLLGVCFHCPLVNFKGDFCSQLALAVLSEGQILSSAREQVILMFSVTFMQCLTGFFSREFNYQNMSFSSYVLLNTYGACKLVALSGSLQHFERGNAVWGRILFLVLPSSCLNKFEILVHE